jgi:hypothetical protein
MGTLQAIGTPAVHTASAINQGATAPSVLIATTFSAVRLWSAGISNTVASRAAYGGGFFTTYARLLTSSTGLVLGIVENQVSEGSQVDSGHISIDLGGVLIGVGDNIEFDVNNGGVLANILQLSGFLVTYSIP